jgi:hypothetical protein
MAQPGAGSNPAKDGAFQKCCDCMSPVVTWVEAKPMNSTLEPLAT